MKLILVALVALLGSVAHCRSFEPKADSCDATKCSLPNCLCSALQPPAGLNEEEVPQIVYLTFDSAINVINYPLYQEIFSRTNPNGAQITGTFFITHEYNDYSFTHQLWRNGHDIALESITHKSNTNYWATLNSTGWYDEVIGQRDMIAEFAKIPSEDIVGFRAPFLQMGGDAMYRTLHQNGIQYDSSRTTYRYTPKLWPYTADYEGINYQECLIPPCPVDSYPGFWVSPIDDLIGSNDFPCAFVDTCLHAPKNANETFNLLLDNFENHYNGVRAPFGVHVHAGWLHNVEAPYIKEGYLQFLDYILELGDTYIVSIKKGLEWVKAPVSVDNITDFTPWQQGELPRDGCKTSFSCTYDNDHTPPEISGERIMKSCVLCPDNYPWLRNPLGA